MQSATPNAVAAPDPIAANDPEFMAIYDAQYEAAWEDGAIPARYKELAGIALSVTIRCDACLGFHIRRAAALGVSRIEMIEAMRLGMVAGGSACMPTMRQGYAYLSELGTA